MARLLISSPTPSPRPSKSWLDAFHLGVMRDYDILTIEYGVLITMILLFVLFVLGCQRRYVHDTWQGGCILFLYTLTTIGIPYLISLMGRYLHFKLFPVWAYFLIFVYGGFDTMTACDLSDNERSLSAYFRVFPLIFGTVYLIDAAVKESGQVDIDVPFVLLYNLTIWNAVDTFEALVLASKTIGLPRITSLTYRYMRNKFNSYDDAEDPVLTARRYSFLVEGNIGTPEKIITTGQIWQCEGQLLNPSAGNDDNCRHNKRSGRLKDLCLSYAFFNILLIRFGGYSLPESSKRELQRFVKEGLREGEQIHIDRAFGIIEVELEFLFDFFYTKFYYLSMKFSAYKFTRLLGIAVCLWVFAVLELGDEKPTPEEIKGQHSSTLFHGHSLEVGITRVVILLIAVLEAVQLCMRVFSNWTIVKLICRYVREPSRTKKGARIEKAVIFISNVKSYLDEGRLLGIPKPWKRKLGQYSLLQSYDHVPILKRLVPSSFLGLFNLCPRVGQKESPAVTLSVQVKRAIVSSLAVSDYGLKLSRGKTSLARNGLGQLSALFDEQEEMSDAHFILVWHIATSVCEHFSCTEPAQVRSRRGDENLGVATQLSKYCAYLVVYAPELLSVFPSTSLITFDWFVEHMLETFKGTKTMEERCIKLLELGTDDIEDGNDIFCRASMLANQLRSYVLNKPNRGWRVIAEFWAEVILYLAPTENVTAHAERLAKGGEFITHLWALLTHTGIYSRASFQTTS